MDTIETAREPLTALRRKDLLGIAELSSEEIVLILDTAEAMKEVGQRADQESADAARPHRRQPVLRAEHAHADVIRDRREAAQRRHAQRRHRHVERGQGRDARRYRDEHRGDGAEHDRAAPQLVRRLSSAVAHLPRGHHQRRRRHARASDAGAARRVHDSRAQGPAGRAEGRDRRRPAPQPRAALEHPAADEARRRGVGVRAGDADSAGPRAARRARHDQRSTRRSKTPTSS